MASDRLQLCIYTGTIHDRHELPFLIFITFYNRDLAVLHLRSKHLLVHVWELWFGQVHCEPPVCRNNR